MHKQALCLLKQFRRRAQLSQTLSWLNWYGSTWHTCTRTHNPIRARTGTREPFDKRKRAAGNLHLRHIATICTQTQSNARTHRHTRALYRHNTVYSVHHMSQMSEQITSVICRVLIFYYITLFCIRPSSVYLSFNTR